MKCPIIKKCGGCFYPQDQYQEELKEKTLFIDNKYTKIKLILQERPKASLWSFLYKIKYMIYYI